MAIGVVFVTIAQISVSVDLDYAKISLTRIEHPLDQTVGDRMLAAYTHWDLTALDNAACNLGDRLDHVGWLAAAVDRRVGKNSFLPRNAFAVPLF